MSTIGTEELVVLVDETGEAVGSAAKAGVHHRATPLHLAFSCYVLDREGRLLLTRRALHKLTWPGAWTNSFCGHPAPDEDIFEAVRRRALAELGIELDDLQLNLPSFRYEATMDNGVRENELCPVFTATTTHEVHPDPAEVDSIEWVAWEVFTADVRAGRRQISPWSVRQVEQLDARRTGAGTHPGTGTGFETASTSELPPAARRTLLT